VLDLGMAYVASSSIWDIARPHLARLGETVHESCSLAQLDGSDIVYVARVAVPKLVTLSVTIGTRFPAVATSLGKVLLAALDPVELERVLAIPSRSSVVPSWQPDAAEIEASLREVRAAGWALTDQQLGPAIRSVAAPVRDGAGNVVAAVNVNAHALETSVETLVHEHLPKLLTTASAISADWARWESLPLAEVS
jgi:IclR family pca regulon transcriptional regulator